MATLNDVLKDVLEKDFDKEDVEKVVNPRDEEPAGTDREAQEGDTENEDVGQTYNGPGDYAQNSIGRSAVESFIKNSVYEKYGIDAKEMRTYSKMTPTEMLSDFGKTVGDLGRIRSDYQTGKIGASDFKTAMSHTKGQIVGKMLEMGSSRKSILEDVFLRSLGVDPEDRSIHSFKDLVDAFRQEESDPVDRETSPDSEQPDIEPTDMDLNPDAEVTPDIENPDVELAEADAEKNIDKNDQEEPEQTTDREVEIDKSEEQSETEEKTESDVDKENTPPDDSEAEVLETDIEPEIDNADETGRAIPAARSSPIPSPPAG